MARPERRNADYFPFYCKDGRTLFLLENKFQCKGTGFFTNVMRFLTLETDHHVNIQDETDRMYFFSKCHCDEESGMDMLNIMAKTGKINSKLWSAMVIASQDLLDSLVDAYRNRKNNMVTIEELVEKYISNAGNRVSGVGNDVSDADKPQRKGKETKEKKTPQTPHQEVVRNYFIDNGYTVESADRFYAYYEAGKTSKGNWTDSRGNIVKNWKQKARAVWFKPENEAQKKLTNPAHEILT